MHNSRPKYRVKRSLFNGCSTSSIQMSCHFEIQFKKEYFKRSDSNQCIEFTAVHSVIKSKFNNNILVFNNQIRFTEIRFWMEFLNHVFFCLESSFHTEKIKCLSSIVQVLIVFISQIFFHIDMNCCVLVSLPKTLINDHKGKYEKKARKYKFK